MSTPSCTAPAATAAEAGAQRRDLPALPAGLVAAPARRFDAASQGWQAAQADALAQEVPVALIVNGISHAVMMASPVDLEDFALGFALTEGLIDTPQQLYGLDLHPTDQGIEVQLEVAAACEWRLKDRRRQLAGRTGCGLCGAESLAQIQRQLPPVEPVTVAASVVIDAQSRLRDQQLQQRLSGATHAAAWCDLHGHIVCLREDVGRHNALDKLIGARKRQHAEPSSGFVLITSRASYEMVQKTVVLGAGLLAAVSAPTALAVTCAHESNLCLSGFVRDGGLVAYTHPERLGAPGPSASL